MRPFISIDLCLVFGSRMRSCWSLLAAVPFFGPLSLLGLWFHILPRITFLNWFLLPFCPTFYSSGWCLDLLNGCRILWQLVTNLIIVQSLLDWFPIVLFVRWCSQVFLEWHFLLSFTLILWLNRFLICCRVFHFYYRLLIWLGRYLFWFFFRFRLQNACGHLRLWLSRCWRCNDCWRLLLLHGAGSRWLYGFALRACTDNPLNNLTMTCPLPMAIHFP